jgi:hypothetical protein
MKGLLTLLLLLLPAWAAFTQSVTVDSIRVEASGKTREKPVLRYFEIVNGLRPGKSYPSEQHLLAALEDSRARLLNTRCFIGVSFETALETQADGSALARITIRLEDSWTLFPLPVFKYDSNYGLIAGGLVRWHNAAGSLTDLTVGIRYNPLIWYAWLEWEHLRLGNLLWDIWIFEQFETIRRIDESDTTLTDFDYLSTELKTRTDIPLGGRLFYTVSPGIRFPYHYRIRTDKAAGALDETGLTPSFEHELYWNGVDWEGTHRRGFYLGVNHTLDWNIPLDKVRNVVFLDGCFFFNRGRFDAAGRLLFFQAWGGSVELLGEYIRGVRDARLWGETALILNLSAGVTILDWDKVGEIQLQPFCDAAFATGREPVITFGLQLLLFVDLFPAWPNTIYAGADALHPGEWEYKMYSGLHTDRKRFR